MLDLRIGELVCLDIDTPCEAMVKVVVQTPNKLFTTIDDLKGNKWTVLSNRLTKTNNLVK